MKETRRGNREGTSFGLVRKGLLEAWHLGQDLEGRKGPREAGESLPGKERGTCRGSEGEKHLLGELRELQSEQVATAKESGRSSRKTRLFTL